MNNARSSEFKQSQIGSTWLEFSDRPMLDAKVMESSEAGTPNSKQELELTCRQTKFDGDLNGGMYRFVSPHMFNS